MSRGRPRIPAEDRFWAKVNKKTQSDCWEWLGVLNGDGYGYLSVDGKYRCAHRFSYELHKGAIPDGMVIMHSCDNPKCVNFNHLSIGTYADNMRDMINKNRQSKRKFNGRSKLSEKEVMEIKNKINLGVQQTEIAKDYGVTPRNIRMIKTGKTWSHINI